LVDTLRVNQAAADLLRDAYSFAGGMRMGIFDGAAVHPGDVRLLLKGLEGMAREGHPDAAAIAAELRKATGDAYRGVAIATPETEAHEQLHFAIDRFSFDAERMLDYAPLRVAVMEARSRGLASGSNERVIREVMVRIFALEHQTVKLDAATAEAIATHFLTHATPDSGQLDTLRCYRMKPAAPPFAPPEKDTFTAEQRRTGERNLARLLVIAKRQGVPIAMEEYRKLLAEKQTKDRNSPPA
jgi:hypothetical protein